MCACFDKILSPLFIFIFQISLRNKTIYVGSGLIFGSSVLLQAASPVIQSVSDLFVSLAAPDQLNFKLFLVGSFARTYFFNV